MAPGVTAEELTQSQGHYGPPKGGRCSIGVGFGKGALLELLLTAMKDRKPSSSDRLKKIQLALYLDADQVDALRAMSGRTRVPQQVLLREGLGYVLARDSAKRDAAAARYSESGNTVTFVVSVSRRHQDKHLVLKALDASGKQLFLTTVSDTGERGHKRLYAALSELLEAAA